jgi:hypothetical protein
MTFTRQGWQVTFIRRLRSGAAESTNKGGFDRHRRPTSLPTSSLASFQQTGSWDRETRLPLNEASADTSLPSVVSQWVKRTFQLLGKNIEFRYAVTQE